MLLFTFICTIILFTVITLGKEPVPEELVPQLALLIHGGQMERTRPTNKTWDPGPGSAVEP